MARRILRRRLPRASEKRWVELASYAGVIFGVLLIAVVCYMEFFVQEESDTAAPGVEAAAPEDAASPEGAPQDISTLAPELVGPQLPDTPEPAEEEPGVRRGEIASGDTAGGLLQEWLSAAEVHAFVEACKPVYPLTKIRIGRPYAVFLEEGSLARFEYEIDNDSRLIVTKENGKWAAKKEDIHYDIVLAKVEGVIDSSLFLSMSNLGESAALAVRLAEIFAWEINFIRDIQKGDSFRVLVEKRYRDGEFKGYGRLPVAEFINKNSKFEAYLFVDSFENPAYFNAGGDSLKRAFLKAPLSFTRISSRFNLQRRHPIFKEIRPHPAVDYAAPAGTPIKAIGSGTVHFRGWGKGAGNYVVLKHVNGYESMYLHMQGFAKTLKKGGRVRQGEVIGYVGSTGYSTGPHLDFRMKKGGKFLNPEKVLSPRDESVPKKKMDEFKIYRDTLRRYLAGELPLEQWNSADTNGKEEPANE